MEQNLSNINATTNKEKILYSSIELFSQKGYSCVSMREIAGTVGIKAASIYNHYTNKEAILDEIMLFFRQQLHKHVYPSFDMGDCLDVRVFIEKLTKANDAFFSDPLFIKIGSIILREQFQNEKIRRMLLEELIQYPREKISAYFERLIHTGKMRAMDPVLAAKEYHSFFIYEFYENSLSQNMGNSSDGKIQQEREEHVRLFLQTWIIEN